MTGFCHLSLLCSVLQDLVKRTVEVCLQGEWESLRASSWVRGAMRVGVSVPGSMPAGAWWPFLCLCVSGFLVKGHQLVCALG